MLEAEARALQHGLQQGVDRKGRALTEEDNEKVKGKLD